MGEHVTDGSAGPDEAFSECSLKAMDLLARRPHFRRQLERKLLERGFEEHDVGRVCDGLERRKILDDLECARSLAAGSLQRKAYGPRRVRLELSRRGAPDDVVEQVVAESFESGETPLLRESASRWLRRNQWNRHRLARHLERKGFSGGAILRIVAELEQSAGEDADHAPG